MPIPWYSLLGVLGSSLCLVAALIARRALKGNQPEERKTEIRSAVFSLLIVAGILIAIGLLGAVANLLR